MSSVENFPEDRMGKHTACSLKTSVQNALLLPKRTVKCDFLNELA